MVLLHGIVMPYGMPYTHTKLTFMTRIKTNSNAMRGAKTNMTLGGNDVGKTFI